MKVSMKKLWKDNRAFLLFLLTMFVFRSVVADWNSVPTGSMKPTILEGDRILVNKMAYDLRIPFTHFSLLKLADPDRGDIIVFDSEKADKRLVKRVAAIPGDTVSMVDNVLSINGVRLPYRVSNSQDNIIDKRENLLGIEHLVRIHRDGFKPYSSFPPITIPDGFYLALGDNRDRSADSRMIGLVPRDEIIGRSRSVVVSLNYDNYYLPRADRFFRDL